MYEPTKAQPSLAQTVPGSLKILSEIESISHLLRKMGNSFTCNIYAKNHLAAMVVDGTGILSLRNYYLPLIFLYKTVK